MRRIVATIEIVILSALILGTRCANHQDVFVAGNVYFADADCYARMTRVQACSRHPGMVIRHQDFENFPTGTTPHTTAPLDYLILGLWILLKPFTAHPMDLAGALISPLLALLGGWFLWWWSKQMKLRYRWVMLILYAISPILVQGTELGRPDHQSLLILLVTVAICAEWASRWEDGAVVAKDRSKWSVVSGVAWGFAIWTSAYESLVLFLLVIFVTAFEKPKAPSGRFRRAGWASFVLVIVIAFLIEQRIPSFSIFYSDPMFQNWARTIGELQHVSPANPIWLRWCGYFLFVTPLLIWISVRKTMRTGERTTPAFVLVLLAATYALTIWQARWGYFFVLIFALVLASLLGLMNASPAVWTAFFLSMFPVLRDWDERLWVNDTQLANRVEQRDESVQLRDLAVSLRSSQARPFIAPWWLSPAIAYWSGQPGVAGSSHESLDGIADSARFFLSDDLEKIRQILANHQTAWIIAYDSERVAQNSAVLLNVPVPAHPLCRVLDRTPSQAPAFLVLSAQNRAAKLYRVLGQ